jgi:hypothetical protein
MIQVVDPTIMRLFVALSRKSKRIAYGAEFSILVISHKSLVLYDAIAQPPTYLDGRFTVQRSVLEPSVNSVEVITAVYAKRRGGLLPLSGRALNKKIILCLILTS